MELGEPVVEEVAFTLTNTTNVAPVEDHPGNKTPPMCLLPWLEVRNTSGEIREIGLEDDSTVRNDLLTRWNISLSLSQRIIVYASALLCFFITSR